MKSLGIEVGLVFLVAAIAVGLVEFRSTLPPPAPQTIEQKAQPHETHPDMLMVAFTIHQAAPPVIDTVKLLAEGRVSTPLVGDNQIKLAGQDGQILYRLSFAADFVLLDGPTDPLEKMNYIFVLPYTPQVAKIVLSTSNGEVVYDVPEDIRQ